MISPNVHIKDFLSYNLEPKVKSYYHWKVPQAFTYEHVRIHMQYTYETYLVPENKVPGQEDEVADREGFQVAENSLSDHFNPHFLHLIKSTWSENLFYFVVKLN